MTSREGTVPLEEALGQAESFLAALERGEEPTAGAMGRAAPLLARIEGRGTEALARLLSRLRPRHAYREDLEKVYDALHGVDPPRAVTEVGRIFRTGDPVERALALHLIHRARDPAYLPLLEEDLARSGDSGSPELVKTLWWIYARGEGIEPAGLRDFARRFAKRVEDAPDEQARALATGLLDLEDAGAEAFVSGLRGPRRAIYLEGLGHLSQLVPIEVSEAVLDGVGPSTSVAERHAAWIATYRTARPEAAPAMAAALKRLEPEIRAESEDLFEALRHRASR
jgi:hypothetical protein